MGLVLEGSYYFDGQACGMKAVVDGEKGMVLVFDNVQDLAKAIVNLRRMIKYKHKEKVPYPAAYWSGPDEVSDAESDAFIAQARRVANV